VSRPLRRRYPVSRPTLIRSHHYGTADAGRGIPTHGAPKLHQRIGKDGGEISRFIDRVCLIDGYLFHSQLHWHPSKIGVHVFFKTTGSCNAATAHATRQLFRTPLRICLLKNAMSKRSLSLSLSLFLSLKTERRKREKHIGTRITGRNAVEALVARR